MLSSDGDTGTFLTARCPRNERYYLQEEDSLEQTRPKLLCNFWKHRKTVLIGNALLFKVSFDSNSITSGMAESVVFSALLGWPGSRPSARNARQDIPPFRQHGQRCQPLLQPAEGIGRDLLLFSLFVYLLYSGSRQRALLLPSSLPL